MIRKSKFGDCMKNSSFSLFLIKKMRCKTSFYDPIVNYWDFTNGYSIEKNFLNDFDVYVYLIKHQSFKKLNIQYKKNSLVLDLNHVIENKKRSKISNNKNYESYFIGSKKLKTGQQIDAGGRENPGTLREKIKQT